MKSDLLMLIDFELGTASSGDLLNSWFVNFTRNTGTSRIQLRLIIHFTSPVLLEVVDSSFGGSSAPPRDLRATPREWFEIFRHDRIRSEWIRAM